MEETQEPTALRFSLANSALIAVRRPDCILIRMLTKEILWDSFITVFLEKPVSKVY